MSANHDPNERARELLAAEWEADGQVMLSGMIRIGHPAAVNNEHTQRALRAIARALSHAAAVEGGAFLEMDMPHIPGVNWRQALKNAAFRLRQSHDAATKSSADDMDALAVALAGYTTPPPAPAASSDRDAYEGAREDLLDWKGRAQRAEARLRAIGYTGIEASEQPAPAAVAGGDADELLAKLHRLARAINDDTMGDDHLNLSAKMLELLDNARFSRYSVAALAAQPAAGDGIPTGWPPIRRYTHEFVGDHRRWKVEAHEDAQGPWCKFSDVWAAAMAAAQRPGVGDDAVFRLACWMAKNDGHDDPHHLIWEGSPPEPWGEVWNRYEDSARSALTAALSQPASGEAS